MCTTQSDQSDTTSSKKYQPEGTINFWKIIYGGYNKNVEN